MRICILSMQKVHNFGSVLQAYALKTILEQLGHSVKFIDIEKHDQENGLIVNKRKQEELKHETFVQRMLTRNVLNKISNRFLLKKQIGIFQNFQKEYLGICDDANTENYDYCVIGSDEVFNCTEMSEWGFTSQLFGNVSQAKKVITYAASCGATTIDDVPIDAQKLITKYMDQLLAISVRDKNTAEFVQALVGKPCSMNCDPVLFFNFDKEIANTTLPENLPEKYCVLYSYYNRICQESEISEIKKFCAKHEMKIVVLGGAQFWTKNFWPLNPFQVLKVFQKAEFVITDTFHGTIFASKYASRFATIVRSSNQNKLGDLIRRLKIEDHQIISISKLDEYYYRIHDKTVVRNIEKQGMIDSVRYFQTNLRE